ncbi:30S ribosomal protein S13 [archaeon]|nr:30S ribosomal protein S13 [archaeon]
MSEETIKDKRLLPKEEDYKLIRILSKDLKSTKTVYSALTEIKGISWNFCNALCIKLKIDRNKKIEDLTPEEIEEITNFVKNPDIPNFMKNRQKDVDSGEDKHLQGSDLDLQKEFDIKKMRKVKSYKGIRHGLGLPVRGQRTKANFRKNRKKSGATGGKAGKK